MAHAQQRAAGLGKSMGAWLGTLLQACTVKVVATLEVHCRVACRLAGVNLGV